MMERLNQYCNAYFSARRAAMSRGSPSLHLYQRWPYPLQIGHLCLPLGLVPSLVSVQPLNLSVCLLPTVNLMSGGYMKKSWSDCAHYALSVMEGTKAPYAVLNFSTE